MHGFSYFFQTGTQSHGNFLPLKKTTGLTSFLAQKRNRGTQMNSGGAIPYSYVDRAIWFCEALIQSTSSTVPIKLSTK